MEASNSATEVNDDEKIVKILNGNEHMESSSPVEPVVNASESAADILNGDASCSTTMSLLAATYGMKTEEAENPDEDEITIIGEESLQSRSLASLSTLNKVINQVISTAPLNRPTKVALPTFVRGRLPQNDLRKVQQENAAVIYRERREKSNDPSSEIVIEEELSEEDIQNEEEEAGGSDSDYEPSPKAFKGAKDDGYVKAGYRFRGSAQRPPNYDHQALMEWNRIAEEKRVEEDRKRKEEFAKKKRQQLARRQRQIAEEQRDMGQFFDMLKAYVRNEEGEAAEDDEYPAAVEENEDDVEVLDVVSQPSAITLKNILDARERNATQLPFSTVRTRTSVPSFTPRRVVHIPKRPVNLFDQSQPPRADDSFSSMPAASTRVLMPKSKIIRPKLPMVPPRPLHFIPPSYSLRTTTPSSISTASTSAAMISSTPAIARQTIPPKPKTTSPALVPQATPTLTTTPTIYSNEVYQIVTIPPSMFPKNGEPLQLYFKMPTGSNAPQITLQPMAATSPKATEGKVLDEITLDDDDE